MSQCVPVLELEVAQNNRKTIYVALVTGEMVLYNIDCQSHKLQERNLQHDVLT